ncbi:YgcG family protein [Treponema phagedenis]|uniref:TPM domain-containing protein n=1 Tax=Treponema phagedenis TaxID=162 RepID=UPI00197F5D9A|nr:TPM domain-containing protein [Treponema phagedenis]QSH99858.1 YgcG family protein [Treponema phagedenis]
MKKKIAVFVFFLLCFIAAALEVPPLKWPVTDTAGILTKDEHEKIYAFLRKTEANSSLQIAVLIIPALQGEVLENYSMRVAEKWKIGKKGKDSGVILLVSKNDRKIRIEVGYGLEGFITDAKASSIIRNVIAPQFRKEKYGEGIYQAVENIAGLALQDESLVSSIVNVEPAGKSSLTEIIFAIIFGVCAPIAVFILILRKILLGIDKYLAKKYPSTAGLSTEGRHYSSSSYSSSSYSSSSYSGGGGSFGGGGASGGW